MEIAIDMINNAITMLKSSDRLILHSDQGWQYQMKPYQRILKENNITQSMSRKGERLDNACIENFFGRLKVEMFYGRTYTSVSKFIKTLHDYVFFHNNQRISLKLNGLTPVQYRNQSICIN